MSENKTKKTNVLAEIAGAILGIFAIGAIFTVPITLIVLCIRLVFGLW